MILHTIERHQPVVIVSQDSRKGSGKFKGIYGSDEHKEFIYNRSYMAFNFKAGDQVWYHKRKKAIITEVYCPYGEHIEWTGLKPRFIEILCDGGVYVVHPSSLKRMR